MPSNFCSIAPTIKAAASLLRLSWHAVNQITQRAIARGLSRRNTEAMAYLGIDEKSFKAGHQYVMTLNDLEQGCVLEVVEHRTGEAAKALLESLNRQQKQQVKAVPADMWQPFASAVRELLPKADLVYDRFHISKYLNEASMRCAARSREHSIEAETVGWLAHNTSGCVIRRR